MKVQVGRQMVDSTKTGVNRADGSVTVGGANDGGANDGGATAWVEGDQVWIAGRVRRVRLVRERSEAVLPDRVTPPMPATVVRVLVAVGDPVERGQKLVTIAAMKMETTLRAPRAGTVRAVHATPGQQVRPGQELVEIG